MKVELHVHTRYSHDSLLGYGLLAFICKIKKIDCIAICDHNTVAGAIKYKQLFKKLHIEVIVGEEIFTREGEIIGLFIKSNIQKGLSAEETVNRIKDQNGLVYVPHPYDEKRYKTVLSIDALKKIVQQVDFIEIHNGRNVESSFSKKQLAIAQEYTNSSRTVYVTGSDAHTFFEIGRNYMLIDSIDIKSPEKFKASLKSARLVTSECIPISHFATRVARIIKLLMEGEFYELSSIIHKKCTKRN